MKIINKYLQESTVVGTHFIVHIHNPRSGSKHFDLRFIDNRNPKLLNSFAFGKDFDEKLNSKIVGVRTRDHDPRWLTLKSYRLEVFDKGEVDILISSFKFFELNFHGEKLQGNYKLFKINSGRGDNWMLVKNKK